MEQSTSREDLEMKVRGLLERISVLTANYENTVADLRVALTNVSNERDELLRTLTELKESESSFKSPGVVGSEVDTVEGEVVE
jgi:uncharacterized protein YeeX (DUF496 family)